MNDEVKKEKAPEVAPRNNKTAVESAGAGKAPEKAKEEVKPIPQASLFDCLKQKEKQRAQAVARAAEEAKIEAEVRKRMAGK